MADFGTFAASRSGGRPGGTPAASNGGGTVKAARAAKQNTQVKPGAPQSSGGKATGGTTGGSTGGKTSGGQSGAGKTTGNNQKASGVKPNGARAAATQKVLNTGTKIAQKSENTIIPKECQDAYYGCMDTFCMLDNTSGGRCQCSDRSKDLNPLLDEITKIDQIAYTMATEGVERLQMGENAEQVIAMARAAGSKVSSTDNGLGIQSADDYAANAGKNRKTSSVRKELDLNAFKVGVFDDDDDDVFGDGEKSEAERKAEVLEDSMANKVGDDLRSAANKLCVEQMPKQCIDSTSMLQLAYTQKIKSDCNAYENSLKQQKIASNQKLAAAEKALREAALESFEKENKYELGPCITEFTKCIQKDAGCGEDYTGCTTLSAKDNVKNKKGLKTTIPGTTVQISVSTLEAITAKKSMCAHVTKQCVKANQNDAVWNAFLKNIAPALVSAEEIAEEKLRMECIPNIADCFQKACAQKFDPKAKEANYDSCLSDPTIVLDLCKVKVEPCLEATGGSLATKEDAQKSSLWKGVLAALGSMKVDACTEEVKACLTSENACGQDYTGCVGLGTEDIVNLCPTDKLTACMTANNGDEKEVRNYVNKVAQGIALNIDNSMMAVCEAALKTAMNTYCGDENSCSNVKIPESNFKQEIQVKFCKADSVTDGPDSCKETLAAFGDNDIVHGNVIPRIVGVSELAALSYKEDGTDKNSSPHFVALGAEGDKSTEIEDEDIAQYVARDEKDKSVSNLSLRIMAAMNSALKMKIQEIENDPKVSMCMKGRDVQKTDGSKIKGTNNARFPNLTKSARTAVAEALHQQALMIYEDVMKQKRDTDLQEKRDEIAKRMEELGAKEAAQDAANKSDCEAMYKQERDIRRYWKNYSAKRSIGKYDPVTNICTKHVFEYNCKHKVSPLCWKWGGEDEYDDEYDDATTQMKQIIDK